MKKLILVTSPPACGKTFISKKLAEALDHVVYLDKDTLICLSKQIFKVADQPYNRSSDFFNAEIRDYEYEAVMALAMEALTYEDLVLINAPFTREIRDDEYIKGLKEELKQHGAKLIVVWVRTEPEVCHQRMIDRASDRDTWKLTHWHDYIKNVNFNIPTNLEDPDDPGTLLIFNNSSEEEFNESLEEIKRKLEE